jgi:hypothetical protein
MAITSNDYQKENTEPCKTEPLLYDCILNGLLYERSES